MSNKNISGNYGSTVNELLTHLSDEVDNLKALPIAEVSQKIGQLVVEQVKENPYLALATAAGIGFGLGTLKKSHFKSAAIAITQLIITRTLSGFNNQPQTQEKSNDYHH